MVPGISVEFKQRVRRVRQREIEIGRGGGIGREGDRHHRHTKEEKAIFDNFLSYLPQFSHEIPEWGYNNQNNHI